MTYVCDRIVEGYAVLVSKEGKHYDIPAEMIPGLKEGDVVNVTVDKEQTAERKERIKKLSDSLFED